MDNTGTRINAILARKGILQKELAARLGVKDNVVSYFVKGTRKPNIDQICIIADFLGVTTDELLLGTKPQNTSISRELGLSDAAIDTLRQFNENSRLENDGIQAEALCRALSQPELLNLLSSILLVDDSERGYFAGCVHTPGEPFYAVELSPDSYTAYLISRLTQALTAMREGRQLPDYPPAIKRVQDTIKEVP